MRPGQNDRQDGNARELAPTLTKPSRARLLLAVLLAGLLGAPLLLGLGCAKAPWVDRTVVTEDVNGVWLGFMARPNGEPMVNGQVRLELQQRASKVTGSVYASSSWVGSR